MTRRRNSPLKSRPHNKVAAKTAALALSALVGFQSPGVFAGGMLNEWERIQPQGVENGIGGPVFVGFQVADGQAIISSSFSNIYRRTSVDSPWIETTLVVDGQDVDRLRRVEAHPTFPNVVTAGVSYGFPNFGVARSTDAGATWTNIYTTTSPNFVAGLAVAPSDPNIIYLRVSQVGMVKTLDGGTTWTTISDTAPDSFSEILVDPTDPDTLYASDGGTLVKSIDGGVTFAPATNGMNPNFDYVEDMAIDFADANVLFAASSNTDIVFKTVDGGENWSTIRLAPNSPSGPVSDVAIDPTDSNHLLATSGFSGSAVVHESTDAGMTWNAIPDPRGVAGAGRLAFAANGDVMILAATGVLVIEDGQLTGSNQGFNDFNFNGLRVTGSNDAKWYGWGQAGGVVSTNPAAPLWENRNVGMGPGTNDVHVNSVDPQSLFAASTNGLFSSANGGTSWTRLTTPGFQFFSSVAASDVDTSQVYATQSGEIITSPDAGVTWEYGQFEPSDVTANAAHPIVPARSDAAVAFVATFQNGVYITEDAGAHWARLDAPFADQRINDIELDPLDSRSLYAATETDVWFSSDLGKNWTSLAADIGLSNVFAIVVDPVVRGRVFVRDINIIWARDPRDGTWSTPVSTPNGQGGFVSFGETMVGGDTTSGRLYDVLIDIFRIQLDSDFDGVGDDLDNCILTSNSDQFDGDGDGLGSACDADIAPAANDCIVNVQDLAALRLAFFATPGDANWNPAADFNHDDVVNATDLAIMRASFFGRPGYSSLSDICR